MDQPQCKQCQKALPLSLQGLCQTCSRAACPRCTARPPNHPSGFCKPCYKQAKAENDLCNCCWKYDAAGYVECLESGNPLCVSCFKECYPQACHTCFQEPCDCARDDECSECGTYVEDPHYGADEMPYCTPCWEALRISEENDPSFPSTTEENAEGITFGFDLPEIEDRLPSIESLPSLEEDSTSTGTPSEQDSTSSSDESFIVIEGPAAAEEPSEPEESRPASATINPEAETVTFENADDGIRVSIPPELALKEEGYTFQVHHMERTLQLAQASWEELSDNDKDQLLHEANHQRTEKAVLVGIEIAKTRNELGLPRICESFKCLNIAMKNKEIFESLLATTHIQREALPSVTAREAAQEPKAPDTAELLNAMCNALFPALRLEQYDAPTGWIPPLTVELLSKMKLDAEAIEGWTQKHLVFCVRHLIVRGNLHPAAQSCALTGRHLDQLNQLAKFWIMSVAQPCVELLVASTQLEHQLVAEMSCQIPGIDVPLAFGAGSLRASVLVGADEPVAGNHFDEVMNALRALIASADFGVHAVGIGLHLTSIAAQAYTLAVTDWAVLPPGTRVSMIAGIAASIAAAACSIYGLYRIAVDPSAFQRSVVDLLNGNNPSFQSFDYSKILGVGNAFKALIKLILAGFVACGFKEIGKGFADAGAAMRGADTLMRDTTTFFEGVCSWLFNEQDYIREECEANFAANSRLIGQPIGAFVSLDHARKVDEQIRRNTELAGQLNMLITSRDDHAKGACKALLSNLTVLSTALMSRRNEAAAVGAMNQAIRPEPVVLNIWGPPGHGKTTFVNRELIPWLNTTFGLNGKVVTATTSGKDFFPPMSDEDILVIDEFLGAGANDNWLSVFNALASEGAMNLDGAFVKNQNPYFRFIITISNVNPGTMDFHGKKYTKEYQEAFRTRLFPVEYTNTQHDKNLPRAAQRGYRAAFRINSGGAMRPTNLEALQVHLKKEFERFDKSYRERLAAKQLSFQAGSGRNPAAISLNGPPGSGKTTLAAELGAVYSSLLNLPVVKPQEYKPTGYPAIYILDDAVIGHEEEYNRLYDSLDNQSVLITTNNLTVTRTAPYFWAARGYPHGTFYNLSPLKVVGTPRRLGFSAPWNIGSTYDQQAGSGVFLMVNTFVASTVEGKTLTVEAVHQLIADHIQHVRTYAATVRDVPVLPAVNSPSIVIDVNEPTRSEIMKAYLTPSPGCQVTLNGLNVEMLMSLFAERVLNGQATPEAIAASLCYMAARLPGKTAQVRVGALRMCVTADGVFRQTAGNVTANTVNFIDHNEDSVATTHSGKTIVLGMREIHLLFQGQGSSIPNFWALSTEEKIAIIAHVEKYRNTKEYRDYVTKTTIGSSTALFRLSAAENAKKFVKWVMDHKILAVCGVIGAIGGIVGAAAIKLKADTLKDKPKQIDGYATLENNDRYLSIRLHDGNNMMLRRCADCTRWTCEGGIGCRGAVWVHNAYPVYRDAMEKLLLAELTKQGKEPSVLSGSVADEINNMMANCEAGSWEEDIKAGRYTDQFANAATDIWDRLGQRYQSNTKYSGGRKVQISGTDRENRFEREWSSPKRVAERPTAPPVDYTVRGNRKKGTFAQAEDYPDFFYAEHEDGSLYVYQGRTGRYQAISELRPTLEAHDKELEVVRDKVVEATCIVSGVKTGLSARGLYVGGNWVLCNTHLFEAGDSASIADNDNVYWNADVHAVMKERDLTLLKVTDKNFAQKKDLIHCFVTDRDLPSIHEIRLLLVDGNKTTIMGGRGRLTTQLLGENSTSSILWSVSAEGKGKAASVDIYWAGMSNIPTSDGSCGSCYLAAHPRLGSKRILAIHTVGAAASLTTKGAVVTQEDLRFLIAFNRVPEIKQARTYRAPDSLRPWTHPLNPKEPFAVMSPETELFEALESSPAYEIENTGRYMQLGYNKAFYRPPYNRPDHKRSPLAAYTDLQNDCRPSPTKLSEIRPEHRDSHVKLDGRPSMMGTQLSHLSFEPVPMDEELLRDIRNFLYTKYEPLLANWRPLNEHEVLNGILDPASEFFGYVNGIDPTKSAGFFGSYLKHPTKGEYFDAIQTRGGKILKWTNTPHSIAMRERYETFCHLAKAGITLIDTVEQRAKQELLPNEKVDIGKIRLFENCGFAAMLHQRKYYAVYQAILAQNRFVGNNPFVIGMNPYVETSTMYDWLHEISDLVDKGDFSRFDKRTPEPLHRMFGVLDGCLMSKIDPNDFDSEAALERALDESEYGNHAKVIARACSNSVSCSEGVVAATLGSFKSGVWVTQLKDGQINEGSRIYVGVMAHAAAGYPLGIRGNREVIEALDKLRRLGVCGDDLLEAVHRSISAWYNFTGLKREYDLIGMLYDLPSKTGATEAGLFPIDEGEFCSRKFVKINGIVFGALKRSSIERLFHWTKHPSPEQLGMNLETALMEAVFHGRAYYSFIAAEVKKCLAGYFRDHKVKLPVSVVSFNKALAAHLATSSVEWMKLTGLNDELQSALPDPTRIPIQTTSKMQHYASRACDVCSAPCKSQRRYVNHVLNSHPEYKGKLPCPGPFCGFQGTIDEAKVHRCGFSGMFTCLECKHSFGNYEAAANHHRSGHAQYEPTINSYYERLHPSLHGEASTDDARQGKDHHNNDCPPANSDAGEDQLLRKLGASVLKNHVEFAGKIADYLGKKIYIDTTLEDLFDEPYEVETHPGGTWRCTKSKCDSIAFLSRSAARVPFTVWHRHADREVFWGPKGFWVKPREDPGFQAARAPVSAGAMGGLDSVMNSTAGTAGVALAADLPASDNLTVATEPMQKAPIAAPVSVNMTPAVTDPGLPTGPPVELIAMSGPRVILEDAVRKIPTIVQEGVFDTMAESGTILADLAYGSNINPTATKYIAAHEYCAGSFDYTFNVFSNAALSGSLIVAWQPRALPVYTLNDLLLYPHDIISLQGTTSWTTTLHDLRRDQFYRSTAELLDESTMDERPRLIVAIFSQLSAFTGEHGPSVRFKIMSKLNANFCVNNFKGWTGDGASNSIPFPLVPGSLPAANGKSRVTWSSPNDAVDFGGCAYNDKTGLSFPVQARADLDSFTGVWDCALAQPANYWRVFPYGILPGKCPFPLDSENPTLEGLAAAPGTCSITSSLDEWAPAKPDYGLWTCDYNVPTVGGEDLPGTVKVWTYSSSRGTGGIIIVPWVAIDSPPSTAGAKLGTYPTKIGAVTGKMEVLGYDLQQLRTTKYYGSVNSNAELPECFLPDSSSPNYTVDALFTWAESILGKVPKFDFDIFVDGVNRGSVRVQNGCLQAHLPTANGYWPSTAGWMAANPRNATSTDLAPLAIPNWIDLTITQAELIRDQFSLWLQRLIRAREEDSDDEFDGFYERLIPRRYLHHQGAGASIAGGVAGGLGNGLAAFGEQQWQSHMQDKLFNQQKEMQGLTAEQQRALNHQDWKNRTTYTNLMASQNEMTARAKSLSAAQTGWNFNTVNHGGGDFSDPIWNPAPHASVEPGVFDPNTQNVTTKPGSNNAFPEVKPYAVVNGATETHSVA